MPLTLKEVEGYLSEIRYPIYKNDLLIYARAEGAEDEVLTVLESISDRAFANSPDVIPELIGIQK